MKITNKTAVALMKCFYYVDRANVLSDGLFSTEEINLLNSFKIASKKLMEDHLNNKKEK